MIKSYRDGRTKRFAAGVHIPAFSGFRHQAEKRLEILEATTSLDDLRLLRSNRLEILKGSRRGQYSIRINKQWRICFTWPRGSEGPEQVEITDYH